MTLSFTHSISQAQAPGLPRRAGLGLKNEHFNEVLMLEPQPGPAWEAGHLSLGDGVQG